MNTLIENGVIEELICKENFVYILQDPHQFLLTDYKVLQSQKNHNFINCMKIRHNGHIACYYLSNGYRSLAAILSTLDTELFLNIAGNLFQAVLDVKHNGFLSCQHIDISFDKIFIDMNTYKVYLIYVPTTSKLFDDDVVFENELRTSLVKIIHASPQLNEKAQKFATDLSSGTYTLETLNNQMKGIYDGKQNSSSLQSDTQNKTLRVIAMNAANHVEIIVNKDDFILGKHASFADGVITFNNVISRKHCKITNQDGHYMVLDLHSANGTYVNKQRVLPEQPYPLQHGDILRLANSDFQIYID